VRRVLPILGAGLALGAAAALGACGYDPPQTPSQETKQALKVQHALGETKVPGRAGRPVTLATSELEDALALGVVPAGAAAPVPGHGLPRFLGSRAAKVERVGTVRKPDVRRVRALDPDLVLGVIPYDRRIYGRLSDVAPTVIADATVNWKPNLRQDGEALGRTDDAEAMLSAYDRRALKVRRKLRGRAPSLPEPVRSALRRPFVVSILEDVGLPHGRRGPDSVPGARPGAYDEWTLGGGVIAANRILRDLERWAG
jgi:iron complex transport system substrate-binding protein